MRIVICFFLMFLSIPIIDSQDTDDINEIESKFIWIVNDQIYSQNHLDNALSYNPDVILRAWFKWGGGFDSDWTTKSWMIDYINDKSVTFGGGGTYSAFYKDEVTQDIFERIVERNPYNEPEYFFNDTFGNIYHGDIQKKEYLNLLLQWTYSQIDAGVGTLFLDEVNGASSWRTGYSDSSMMAFNAFLIKKYVDGLGWTNNDPLWEELLDIDLLNDCEDGTIQSFDYRKYLIRKGYQDDPSIHSYPLKGEWGDPWNYKLTQTYINERNSKAWLYLAESIRNYIDSTESQCYIAANGWNHYVDYQIEGVWYRWKVVNGRLSIAETYIDNWREIKKISLNELGRDVPLVVFHDWSWNMPFFDEIPESDRILWLRVYAAEIFASGAIFAWPVSGSDNNYQPSENLDQVMRYLINWYSQNRELFLQTSWMDDSIITCKGEELIEVTAFDKVDENNDIRIVHLINKKLNANHDLEIRTNINLNVLSNREPKSVWSMSPDYPDKNYLDFNWSNNNIDILLDSLNAYSVIVIDYKNAQSIKLLSITDQFTVYPNPADITINITNNLKGFIDFKIEIYDIYCRILHEADCKDLFFENNTYVINIEHFISGIYFIKIKTNNMNKTIPFIKK